MTLLRSALLLLCFCGTRLFAQDTLKVKNVQALLYTGGGDAQALVVGLGGSEGGKAWASKQWKLTRDQFIARGYAFLALGYFGTEGTPQVLDKIALEDVYQAIAVAAQHPQVNGRKIALVGGSRGADLALLLGSYYPSVGAVVGLVPSHAVFPGHTDHFSSSCWTFGGKELPFVPVNDAAVPFLMKGDLRKTFEAMLQDSTAAAAARIKVENIQGPVLLLSATRDEICPSTPSSEAMYTHLKKVHFPFVVEHVAIEGQHAAPLKHFDLVFAFLEAHFLTQPGVGKRP